MPRAPAGNSRTPGPSERGDGMKHPKLVRALVAANVLLLAAAAIVIARPTLVPNAFAQTEAARPRGQYTMVSGKTNQGGPHAVYILDAASREVIALRWDQSRQSLVGVGYRNIEADSRLTQGR